MNDIVSLLSNPLVLKALVGYWIFSSFVGALPSPDEMTKYIQTPWKLLLYRIAFGFLHALAGNLNRAAISLKVPGAQGG